MEIQPAGSQSVLKVAMKGAGQGLKYFEHGVKFLEKNFSELMPFTLFSDFSAHDLCFTYNQRNEELFQGKIIVKI